MSTVRVAIIGAGAIANRHGLAHQSHPGAEIAAGIDADAEKASRFASRWGGRVYDSPARCIDEVDAVYVLAPPSVRKGYALEALSAGKHLFCEKPPASTVDGALEITRAAESTKFVSMMGLNMRYRTVFDRLRPLVHGGGLGRPYHFG